MTRAGRRGAAMPESVSAAAGRVRDAREGAGMSGTDLADATGLHVRTLSRTEDGASIPDMDSLVRIAAATGTDAAWLAWGCT